MALYTPAKSHTRMLAKLRKGFELAVPVTLRTRIKPGDFFRVDALHGQLVLRQVDAIDPADQWFWTPEWQRKEREANEDIEKGHISGPFRTSAEFMRGLKKSKK